LQKLLPNPETSEIQLTSRYARRRVPLAKHGTAAISSEPS
jgi:hypothetical protein